MKKIIMWLSFSIFLSYLKASAQDTSAQRIIEKHLKIIKDFLNAGYPKEFAGRTSVSFLTELTGIASSSGGNFIGPHPPNLQDYLYWEDWYQHFKNSIFWDNKLKAVVIHKEVLLPKDE